MIPLVMANEQGQAQLRSDNCRAVGYGMFVSIALALAISLLESNTIEGDSPLIARVYALLRASRESCCLKVQRKVGDMPLQKLNISTRPIANKYREGKLKSTLKRE